MGGRRSKQKLALILSESVWSIGKAAVCTAFILTLAAAKKPDSKIAEIPLFLAPAPIQYLNSSYEDLLPGDSHIARFYGAHIQNSAGATGRSGSSVKKRQIADYAYFNANFRDAAMPVYGGKVAIELLVQYRSDGHASQTEFDNALREFTLLRSIGGAGVRYRTSALPPAAEAKSPGAGSYAELIDRREREGGAVTINGSLIAVVPQGKAGDAFSFRLDFYSEDAEFTLGLARYIFGCALEIALGIDGEFLKQSWSDSIFPVHLQVDAAETSDYGLPPDTASLPPETEEQEVETEAGSESEEGAKTEHETGPEGEPEFEVEGEPESEDESEE